jgi:4-alpha-glucanotransferase
VLSPSHRLPRTSGLLLHPTSLPGGMGIGDLGHEAYRFVDFLAAAGQQIWQVLPLGPTGYGNSPYAARSAFAGNPLLVSLEQLASEGLLEAGELPALDANSRVSYEAVVPAKLAALRMAAERFGQRADEGQRQGYDAFCVEQAAWLDDYALFMAAHEANGARSWTEWEPGLAHRDPGAMADFARAHAPDVAFHRVTQFFFWRQWSWLHTYANERGIRIMGDIPIFVAFDSADVWSQRREFWLDQAGQPTVVAGVPPDYFSETGQRWGNPLYRWEDMAARGYGWWVERFRHLLRLVDVIRIDHFRGFAASWEIPAEKETAVEGQWVPGPGRDLFFTAREALGELPIVVEDLGLITPDVTALREELGYPGMKVLHFAFDSGAGNPFLPHGYEQNVVVYTGTHDNDTTVAWFAERQPHEREYMLRYLRSDGVEIAWDLIHAAMASVADTAIVPVQDVLGLGTDARMNFPGRDQGNWEWRLLPGQLTDEHAARLRELVETYGRMPSGPEPTG